MNVWVDADAVNKAANDLDDESKFGRYLSGSDDLMKRPTIDRSELCSELEGLETAKALKKTLENWEEKCNDWGGDVETYRKHLAYYTDILKGVDSGNADGLPPVWIDDVPSESENKK